MTAFALSFETFGSPDGPLRHAIVPWDSETFGFPVIDVRADASRLAEVTNQLPTLIAKLDAATSGRALFFTKIALSAIGLGRVLSENGFYPVETMVELHLALAKFKPPILRPVGGMKLRLATPQDLPRIKELAGGAFHADRFHVDDQLPAAAADRRYSAWIERGMRDSDMVFCYEDARGQTLGFYHVRASNEQAVDLSLAAIDRSMQKLGLGLLMYQAVIEECRTRGYSIAETHVTVNNLDVLNLFTRLGFAMRSPTLTFHRYHKKQ